MNLFLQKSWNLMNSMSFFDLSWHLALYSVGSNEGRNPCTCTCATRGTWRGARWISATIEPLELSSICICDGGEVAEASGWVRLILVATVCLRWMTLYGISHCSYQRTWIPRSWYKGKLKCIDEYYPKTLWHCKMEALYECAWRSWRVTLCHGSSTKGGRDLWAHAFWCQTSPNRTRRLQNEHFAANQKAEVSLSGFSKKHAFTQAHRSLPTEKCKLKSRNYHDSWESCRHTVLTSTNTKTENMTKSPSDASRPTSPRRCWTITNKHARKHERHLRKTAQESDVQTKQLCKRANCAKMHALRHAAQDPSAGNIKARWSATDEILCRKDTCILIDPVICFQRKESKIQLRIHRVALASEEATMVTCLKDVSTRTS